MGLTLTTAPAAEPVSTAEAKTHMRVSTSADDTYIDTLIKAARMDSENFQHRQLITATYTLTIDRFPTADYIDLPRPPLQSVTSVKYYDNAGTQQTFSSSYYTVDISTAPGRIYVDRDTGWPSDVDDRRNAVEIIYVAGYGNAGTDVPQTTLHAIKIKAAHWYEHREPIIVGAPVASVPDSAKRLDTMDAFRGIINIYEYGDVRP